MVILGSALAKVPDPVSDPETHEILRFFGPMENLYASQPQALSPELRKHA